jgi:hypothetical protein
MLDKTRRRDFIKTLAAGSAGLGLYSNVPFEEKGSSRDSKRVGIIGLDTSHSVAFTKALNDPSPDPAFNGYRIVAAYPRGSNDIKSSVDRIPGYTEDVKKLGVEITGSLQELIDKVDYVLLETNDGRLHLEQAIPVLKAGKRMFIDKPVAASLSDAIAIYEAADHYKVPVFSSSSLRYIAGLQDITNGSLGKVLGADTYSPATLEKTHPDLFWYGVHGVETLFTIMGTGCKTVSRISSDNFDKVTGLWNDGRIGTFRGIRTGKSDYGGTVFGEKGISVLGKYSGYNPLLLRITEFFSTGVPPLKPEETIEIFTFMEAAQESKIKGGVAVEMEKVYARAKKRAMKIAIT